MIPFSFQNDVPASIQAFTNQAVLLLMKISRRSTASDRPRVRIRYRAVMVIQHSKTR